jgi:putative OPT family oligopeptide transporter
MEKELTLRAIFVGSVLAVIVTMYSAFAGLKIGGVYWPITTVSVMSLGILTILGNTNKHEINIAQTIASAGGLVAAGIIFTIPALYLTGFEISITEITLISLVGGITGVIFSIPLRKEMIEKEKLEYADGKAAAAIILAGDEKKTKIKTLTAMFGIGVIFSFLRDSMKVIPSFWNIDLIKTQFNKLFSFGSSISLIPFSGGYLIGPKFTGIWFLGAVISYFFLIPFVVANNFFADKFSAGTELAKPLGIGIVIGAAIMYFLLKGIPSMKNIIKDWKESFRQNSKMIGLTLIVLVGVLAIITEMNIVLAVIAIFGAFVMAYIGGRVTGEMNVDPMELFAMIVLIAAKLLFGFNAVFLVIIAAVVCISAGVAGDTLQDLKTGFILGTKPKNQFIGQLIGVVVGALVIGLVLVSLQQTYGFGNTELPAPQAVALSSIIKSEALSNNLITGILIGAVLALIVSFFNSAIMVVAFGIGMYVPIELSFPLFVGGIIRFFADKKGLTEKGRLIAAGLIAGEGFTGVILSLLGLGKLI